ncbi:hemerythrin domain-containing protein [Trebonia kvetii]|nr:hemerythrin domain-containing protein [Trebonia kvetii]
MPDVFEVLKKDHDEMKVMLAELEDGPKASDGATAEQLAFRRQALDQVIIEQSKHEAAEQQYFWPALGGLGSGGARVMQDGLEQENEAEPLLAELGKLEPGDEEFEERLTALISAARAHIAFEEAHAWPLLKAAINHDQAQALGDRIAAAKKTAPTRPHPHIPPQAARTAGPVAGVADKVRDILTGRGKNPS